MPEIFTMACISIWAFVLVKALLNNETPMRAYAVIGSACLTGAFVIFYYMPETEGQQITEEMQTLSFAAGCLFLAGFTIYGYRFMQVMKDRPDQ